MERESFEDDATAELLNSNFVSIKVDREERPDVDKVYVRALVHHFTCCSPLHLWFTTSPLVHHYTSGPPHHFLFTCDRCSTQLPPEHMLFQCKHPVLANEQVTQTPEAVQAVSCVQYCQYRLRFNLCACCR